MAIHAPVMESRSSSISPEEKFWTRYSPHHEAPLSLAGSFAVHVLGVGFLALLGLYFASLFLSAPRNVPIDPVRFELPGGNPGNAGQGGQGTPSTPAEVRESEASKRQATPEVVETPRPRELTPIPGRPIEEKFDPARSRLLVQSGSRSAESLLRLEEQVRRKLTEGNDSGGAGKRGAGKGDSVGRQPGPGAGPGAGAGKVKLKPREKRMLRWHMRFEAKDGTEYLAQLRDLGAILAFPVREGPNPVFKVVKNLQPGGKALDEDVARLERIFWIDDRANSVTDLLAALRLRLPGRAPSRFVAFMPKSLEDNLFAMERRYVEKVLKVPYVEDDIGETSFRVVETGGKYRAELVSVVMRK